MQFLEWLDRHFASNCLYYYADDLGCPLDLFPDPRLEPSADTKAGTEVKAETSVTPDRSHSVWQ